MKKILALLLSLVLLLGTCAFAEEEVAAPNCHKLSGIYLIYNDQMIDLSNISFELDTTEDGENSATGLVMSADGETVAELGFAKVDGVYYLHMNSNSLGHKDFGMDPVVYLERSLKAGIDGLIELLKSIDTRGAAESIVNFAQSIGEDIEAAATPEPTPEPTAEPDEDDLAQTIEIQLSKISFDGDVLAVLKDCVSEPQTSHMGGIEYGLGNTQLEMPDGEYTETSFEFSTDTLCKILDMVRYDGEDLGLGDALRSTNIQFLLGGSIQSSDLAHIFNLNGSLIAEDVESSFGINVHQIKTEGGYDTTFSYGTTATGEPSTGVQFTVSSNVHDGASFTPASIDPASAVMLSDMDDEEALDTLKQAFTAMGIDALMPLLPVVGAMMGGMMGDAAAE